MIRYWNSLPDIVSISEFDSYGGFLLKILVLCGGLSNERDVSISTGSGVAHALRALGHRVVLADLYIGLPDCPDDPLLLFDENRESGLFSVAEEVPDLAEVSARRQHSEIHIGPNILNVARCADIVFLALHGEEGENGKLQGLLDMYGIRYTGSGYLGSAIAMNKWLSKSLFHANGIPTAPSVLLHSGDPVDYQAFEYPLVIKPCSGGSSVGTSIVQSASELRNALSLAFSYEEAVLAERFIGGRELTVGVMNGTAMPVIEIIPKSGFYDYKNKYQSGATEEICPAPIPAEATAAVQSLAETVSRVLMIDVYCRVDFLWDTQQNIFYCLEANTLPGMTPTSLIPQMASQQGMSYGELCEKIISVSLKKY